MKILAIALALVLTGCATTERGAQRRASFVINNPDTQFAAEIQRGAIVLGMDKAEVVAAWGDPCFACYGTRETSHGEWWEFNPLGPSYPSAGKRVFFGRDGKVEFWTD